MLWAAILSQTVVAIAFSVRVHLWKYISIKQMSKPMAKEMIKYSFPLIPNKISWTIINLSDRIVLMNTIGSESAGLYAVSYKFPNLMDTIYGFFYQSWKESSARIIGSGADSRDEFYNSVYDYLKNFMYAIVLGMIAFMPLIFRLLINNKYHEALFYVPILLLGTYFSNVSGFYGGIFTAYKDTKIMGTTTLVAAIINLAINLTLIPFIGIYAAAISTLVANVVIYIYRKRKVKRYILLRETPSKSFFAIFITVIMLILFYAENIFCSVIACILSLIYACVTNRRIISSIIEVLKK